MKELPRTITIHLNGNAANDSLRLTADARGDGGASHLYEIRGFDTASNKADLLVARYDAPADHSTVLFQYGPVKEFGRNGVTHEALLAILIDRLEGFQTGPFACDENATALDHLRKSLDALNARTARRTAHGIEGTHGIDKQ